MPNLNRLELKAGFEDEDLLPTRLRRKDIRKTKFKLEKEDPNGTSQKRRNAWQRQKDSEVLS